MRIQPIVDQMSCPWLVESVELQPMDTENWFVRIDLLPTQPIISLLLLSGEEIPLLLWNISIRAYVVIQILFM